MAKKKNRKNKDTEREPSAEAASPSAAPPPLDAAARDRFASSFRPSWAPPAPDEGAHGAQASESAESARPREQTLSGEISLDAIPLPPLPTERPKKQMLGVALVLLLIVAAGVFASMRAEPPSAGASPAAAQPSAP